jgi:hypothetical protein
LGRFEKDWVEEHEHTEKQHPEVITVGKEREMESEMESEKEI